MLRLVMFLLVSSLLCGCGMDSSFERGYIISQSDSEVNNTSDCIDE